MQVSDRLLLFFQNPLQFGERRDALGHEQQAFFLKWSHAGERGPLCEQVDLRFLEQHLAHFVVDFEQLEHGGAAFEAEAAAFLARLFDFLRLGTAVQGFDFAGRDAEFFQQVGRRRVGHFAGVAQFANEPRAEHGGHECRQNPYAAP